MPPTSITAYRSENLVVDHIYYESAASFPSHIHDAYELLYLIRGDATYTVEGRAYHLPKGSLIITRPLEVHAITVHAPSEYERYDILFDSSILSTEVCAQLPAKLDVLLFSGNTIIPELFRKMDYYCGTLSGDMLKAMLTHLTEEILINAQIASREDRERSSYTTDPLVNQATKYIAWHLTEHLTVEDVCRELHISQSYLLYLFGKHLNISPKKYIMSKRLAMAQMALRSGNKPTVVCKQCGFSDYSTFFRAYQKYFGHAPTKEPDLLSIHPINS